MRHWLTLLLLLLASPAWGAYALVADVAIGDTVAANDETSAAIDTTGADLLVCLHAHYGEEGVYGGTPTDSKANTWTLLRNSEGYSTIGVWYATNVSGKVGAGHTFTTKGHAAGLHCSAWSGAHTTAPADQGRADAYTPYADNLRDLATGTITPAEDNELIIAGWAVIDLTSSSGSVDSGFTLFSPQLNWIEGAHNGSFAAYKVQTTAAVVNPIGSWVGQTEVAAVIASFKVPSAGGAAPAAQFRRR